MSTLERFAITGGSALLPSGFQDDVVITVDHGVIVEIGSEVNGAPVMDARGLRFADLASSGKFIGIAQRIEVH